MRLAAIAIIAALCAVTIKKHTLELALVLAIAACVLLVSQSFGALSSIRAAMDMLLETAQLSPVVLTPIVKTVGISIITKLASELCRDAGEGALAFFSELAGTAAALVAALPLITAVLSMITGLL